LGLRKEGGMGGNKEEWKGKEERRPRQVERGSEYRKYEHKERKE